MRRLTLSRPYCSAIVPAAGSSERMGRADKMFCRVSGVPVLALSLLALEGSKAVDEIIIAVRPDMLEQTAELVREYGIHKVSSIVVGGKNRLESVASGATAVKRNADVILVHDGARPLVTPEIIEETVARVRACLAVTCAVPVKDTVKSAKNGIVISSLDRSTLFTVQTPQAFNADIFRAAVHNAIEKNLTVTDDCMAVEAIGVPVHLTAGSYENIKITTPEDLLFAEAIIKLRSS